VRGIQMKKGNQETRKTPITMPRVTAGKRIMYKVNYKVKVNVAYSFFF
jgi:hypothetical protein